ncbi:MAG: site-2 protease family protein [Nitrospirae bacterium]|nr:site-2 protease family protein [Nitrospirota bacterium]
MFEESWQIGRIIGIPVRVHFSWFIIFGLITWALATQYFPQVAPELPHATNWLRGAIAALLLFLSVIIHELSHSFVARRYQIPITSITLFIFGGVARLQKEPSSPRAELYMALAGPFSSYLLGIFFFILHRLLGNYHGLQAIAFYLLQLNFILGTFNLIPGYPMDGGRVLRAFLWQRSGDYLSATKKASKAGERIALIFIAIGFVSLLSGYFGSIWFLLIGWFLYTSAQSSYRQADAKGILSGVKVRDVMTADVVTVNAHSPLSEVIDDYFLRYGYNGFPVVDGEDIAGIISLRDVKELPKERWASTSAKDVMHLFDRSLEASEDDDVSVILDRMINEDKGRLIVINNGKLSGLITRSGIIKFLQIKGELK